MFFQISNLKKTKTEGLLSFTAVLFVETDAWLMIPGFRISKGTIWPPSRKAGNYWPRTIHMSEKVIAQLIDEVAKETTKFGILLDKEKALKSLRADQVDLLIIAADILPDEMREEAQAALDERKAKKIEREVPAENQKKRILTL